MSRACFTHYLDVGTDEEDALAVLVNEAVWTVGIASVLLPPDACGAVAAAERLLRPEAEL